MATKSTKPQAFIYIQTTENNTIITLTDLKGNTKAWASAGSCGFPKTLRSNPFGAKAAAKKIAKDARALEFRFVHVILSGNIVFGKRKGVVKGLFGLQILKIIENTKKPHNGCRAPKEQRK